jgi:hypothetical protein
MKSHMSRIKHENSSVKHEGNETTKVKHQESKMGTKS